MWRFLRRVGWTRSEAFNRSLKPLQTADIGDPRFLAQILQCTIHRRALLGLDSPTLVTVSEEQLNEEIEGEMERIRNQRS